MINWKLSPAHLPARTYFSTAATEMTHLLGVQVRTFLKVARATTNSLAAQATMCFMGMMAAMNFMVKAETTRCMPEQAATLCMAAAMVVMSFTEVIRTILLWPRPDYMARTSTVTGAMIRSSVAPVVII